MDTTAIRNVAKELLEKERPKAKAGRSEEPPWATFEKLRLYLTQFIGEAGFNALLSRALARGRSSCSALQEFKITDQGLLEGNEHISSAQVIEAQEVLLGELLALLVLFVGEELTLRLLRDLWPSLPILKGKLSKD
ncbi:MAG: hypothetical protein J5J00_08010 [Deltaproteobacteria bacterium]|nr:hypothetical protein [Deltaproteobacteria bacterium]